MAYLKDEEDISPRPTIHCSILTTKIADGQYKLTRISRSL